MRTDIYNELVCPITKQILRLLSLRELNRLNQAIKHERVHNMGGEHIIDKVEMALINENLSYIFLFKDDIPVLVEEKCIDTSQIHDWKMKQ